MSDYVLPVPRPMTDAVVLPGSRRALPSPLRLVRLLADDVRSSTVQGRLRAALAAYEADLAAATGSRAGDQVCTAVRHVLETVEPVARPLPELVANPLAPPFTATGTKSIDPVTGLTVTKAGRPLDQVDLQFLQGLPDDPAAFTDFQRSELARLKAEITGARDERLVESHWRPAWEHHQAPVVRARLARELAEAADSPVSGPAPAVPDGAWIAGQDAFVSVLAGRIGAAAVDADGAPVLSDVEAAGRAAELVRQEVTEVRAERRAGYDVAAAALAAHDAAHPEGAPPPPPAPPPPTPRPGGDPFAVLRG